MLAQRTHFFFFFFFFGLSRTACRILVPQLGMECVCPALEAQRLNHWTTWGVPGEL